MSSDAFLSVSAITAAVRSKTFFASELLEAHLQRIERFQPKLNAFVPLGVRIIGRPYEDEFVLAVAEALEDARGPSPNP